MSTIARSTQLAAGTTSIARSLDGIVHIPMTLRSLRSTQSLPDVNPLESSKYPGLVLDRHFWRSALDMLPRPGPRGEIDGSSPARLLPQETGGVGVASASPCQLHRETPPGVSVMQLTEANLTSPAHEAQASLFDTFATDGKIDARGLAGLLAAFGAPCSDKMAEALIVNVSAAAEHKILTAPHQTPKLGYPEVGLLLSAVSLAISKASAVQSLFVVASPPSSKARQDGGRAVSPASRGSPTLHLTPQRQQRLAQNSPARRLAAKSPPPANRSPAPSSGYGAAASVPSLSASHLPTVQAGSIHSHTLVSVRRSPSRPGTPTRPMNRLSPSRAGSSAAATSTPAQTPARSASRGRAPPVVEPGRQAFSPVITPRAHHTPSRTDSNLVAVRSPTRNNSPQQRSTRVATPKPTLQSILEDRSDIRRSLDVTRSPASKLEPRNSIGQLGVWTPSRW